MRLKKIHEKFSTLLKPLALPYAAILRQRRRLYSQGILRQYESRCPTVSIGNIALGGSGKTPFTSWLLSWASRNKIKTAVLSRGYGGKPGPLPIMVESDSDPKISGDEPLLLKRKHPEAIIAVHPKRKLAAEQVEKESAPELILLDDGMQHLAIKRSLDIVILKVSDLGEMWNKVLPHGFWREDASALSCATAFAIKVDAEKFSDLIPLAEEKLSTFNKPLFSFNIKPLCLISMKNRQWNEPLCNEALRIIPEKGLKYVLVSGVGDPAQVEDSLLELMGERPSIHLKYPDHHSYSLADIAEMLSFNKPVLCTEKDAVKIERLLPENADFYRIDIRLDFGPKLFTDVTFPEWWEEKWSHLKTKC